MTLLRLATMLMIISFSGPLVWAFVANLRLFDADFIVSATAFTVGVVTFFGVTELNRSSEDRRVFREENLRTAIASSLVLSYHSVCTELARCWRCDEGTCAEFFSSHFRDSRFLFRRKCSYPDFRKAQRK
jgi:hypothetical protein